MCGGKSEPHEQLESLQTTKSRRVSAEDWTPALTPPPSLAAQCSDYLGGGSSTGSEHSHRSAHHALTTSLLPPQPSSAPAAIAQTHTPFPPPLPPTTHPCVFSSDTLGAFGGGLVRQGSAGLLPSSHSEPGQVCLKGLLLESSSVPVGVLPTGLPPLPPLQRGVSLSQQHMHALTLQSPPVHSPPPPPQSQHALSPWGIPPPQAPLLPSEPLLSQPISDHMIPDLVVRPDSELHMLIAGGRLDDTPTMIDQGMMQLDVLGSMPSPMRLDADMLLEIPESEDLIGGSEDLMATAGEGL